MTEHMMSHRGQLSIHPGLALKYAAATGGRITDFNEQLRTVTFKIDLSGVAPVPAPRA